MQLEGAINDENKTGLTGKLENWSPNLLDTCQKESDEKID